MTPTTPPPTIDFAQVRQRCPKAYECWLAWRLNILPHQVRHSLEGVPDHIIVSANQYLVGNLRDLYDFFDEQGVYVLIDRFGHYPEYPWSFEIDATGWNIISQVGGYPARAAAEVAAFTSAFEKLEELLQQ